MILVVFTFISDSHFPLGAHEKPVKASPSRQSVALSTRIIGQIPPLYKVYLQREPQIKILT